MNKKDWVWLKRFVKKNSPCKLSLEPMVWLNDDDQTVPLAGCYCSADDTITLSLNLRERPLLYSLLVYHHECWHKRFEDKYLANVWAYKCTHVKYLGQPERMLDKLEELFCNLFGAYDAVKVYTKRRKNET